MAEREREREAAVVARVSELPVSFETLQQQQQQQEQRSAAALEKNGGAGGGEEGRGGSGKATTRNQKSLTCY
jgi:hypothetical protein